MPWRMGLLLGGIALAVALPAPAGAQAIGQREYELRCLVCHGPAGNGVDGLGASLVDSEYVRSRSVEQLIEFLKLGRLPNDPDTVSGRAMPGFAWIDEAQLAAIAAYVKSMSAA